MRERFNYFILFSWSEKIWFNSSLQCQCTIWWTYLYSLTRGLFFLNYYCRVYDRYFSFLSLIILTVLQRFFTENKAKTIVACLESVLMENFGDEINKCEAQLQCLRRLFASKSGFQAFTAVPGWVLAVDYFLIYIIFLIRIWLVNIKIIIRKLLKNQKH